MIGASKILTVSYGTFSCTLEGFEEPFNTMKAIAEYFRDLAAEDRYFGAEPPTPDAAMLHRIAEREIQRRVEAKIEDNGVILRAADLAPSAAPAPAAPRAAPSATGLLAEESVAAKLQRIRSAVARSAAAAPVIEDAAYADEGEAAPIDLALAADAPIDALRDQWEDLDAAAEETVAAPVSADGGETLHEVFEDETAIEAPPAEAPATQAETDRAEATPEAATLELPEPVADIFEEDLPEANGAAAEDDLPEAYAAPAEDDLPEADPGPLVDDLQEEADLIATLSAYGAPDAAAPAAETAAEAETDLSDILASLNEPAPEAGIVAEADLETEIVAEVEFEAELIVEIEPESDTAEVAAAMATTEPDIAAPYAEAPAVTVEDAPAEAAAPARPMPPEDDYDDEIIDEEPIAASEARHTPPLEPFVDEIAPASSEWPADPEAPVSETSPAEAEADVSDKLRRARARVIKVRRPDASEPALTPEAEAELARELSAAREEADDGARNEGEGRSILESAAKGDEDVTRLLRQTNTEMEGPENRRRMSTLAHLKAAVAATVAELRAPNPAAGTGEPSRLERYRADLARVVLPRRPGESVEKTERPAPLVLVSEQRIDRPATTDALPGGRVMPRRVSSGNLALNDHDDEDDEDMIGDELSAEDADNIFASSKSFAEFAERLGASEMPDLLEAAAAYTACIEGRPHFSRPHLMRHVAAVADDTAAGREDSMRSFGQLLRQGKIEKVKRGQFAITDSSYYLAEARRMVR